MLRRILSEHVEPSYHLGGRHSFWKHAIKKVFFNSLLHSICWGVDSRDNGPFHSRYIRGALSIGTVAQRSMLTETASGVFLVIFAEIVGATDTILKILVTLLVCAFRIISCCLINGWWLVADRLPRRSIVVYWSNEFRAQKNILKWGWRVENTNPRQIAFHH